MGRRGKAPIVSDARRLASVPVGRYSAGHLARSSSTRLKLCSQLVQTGAGGVSPSHNRRATTWFPTRQATATAHADLMDAGTLAADATAEPGPVLRGLSGATPPRHFTVPTGRCGLHRPANTVRADRRNGRSLPETFAVPTCRDHRSHLEVTARPDTQNSWIRTPCSNRKPQRRSNRRPTHTGLQSSCTPR
jgi:hypothetical protein